MTSSTELERKYITWLRKLRELVDAHDLSLDVSMSWRTDWDGYKVISSPYLVFYTARADHIEAFRGLGLVTGWFNIEPTESVLSTLWQYEIKLLVD